MPKIKLTGSTDSLDKKKINWSSGVDYGQISWLPFLIFPDMQLIGGNF